MGEQVRSGQHPQPRCDIIVNVGLWGTRVAIIEDGQLVELLTEREPTVVGNIYKGVVEDVVPGLDAAFVNIGIERNVFLHVSDALPYDPVKTDPGSLPSIRDVVREGQELIVQVTKGPIESKGARACVRIALPGRCVVLIKDERGTVGVSKKITDEAERQRLRELAARLRPRGWGLIVRTRAQGAGRQEIQSDIRFLRKTWATIERKARHAKAPALLYEDLSLVFELLRDVVDQRVQRLAIDDRATYERALDLLSHMAPELRDRVELHDEDIPIFVKYGVEREIDRALRPRVWLPHGGHISIEETEALTAVDVNSGRFTSRSSLEDTILQTNLEAAEEIARQLRLRDIGGIIVIDFIDMQKARHRQQVLRVFRDALARDRMRTRVMHITRLGLLEMTRKRTDVSLSHILQDECPHCGGTGRILNATFVAERVLTDLMILAKDSKAEAFAVLVDPHVALCLVGPEGAIAEKIEKEKLGRPVLVRTRKHLRRDYCEITPGKLSTLEKQFGFLIPGDIVEVRPEDMVDVPHSCPLAMLRGVIVEIPDVAVPLKAPIRVRITRAGRSYGRATVV